MKLLTVVIIAFSLAGAVAFGHPEAALTKESAEAHRDLTRVIDALRARVEADPADTRARLRFADAMLALGRRTGGHDALRGAEQAFRGLLGVDAARSHAHVGLGNALLGLHRFAESLEAAREAAALDPDAVAPRALLFDAHLAVGNYAEAEAIAHWMTEHELSVESLSRLALIHHQRGRESEARAAMEEALQACELLDEPASTRAWCMAMLGDFALEGGELVDAEDWYARAIALAPHADHADYRLAMIESARGDIEGAESRLINLVARSPRPRYQVALAEVHLLHGEPADLEAAEHLFASAESSMRHEIEHGEYGHARDLAMFWLDRGRETDRAVELAIRELREVRQDAEAWETAAWALHRAGRQTEALEHIHRAVLLAPGDASILCRAGIIYAANDRASDAAELLGRALARKSALSPVLRDEAERVHRSLASPGSTP